MISTGLGINIFVETPSTITGDWMAFCLCYSIKKYIPDAKLYLKRITKNEKSLQFFNWSTKLGLCRIKNITNPIVLECDLIMVRPIERDTKLTWSEARDNKFTPFLSYREGCGNFVYDEWINKEESPFPHADNFMMHGISANELNILRLWKQMHVLYPFLSRS